jgi:hypothetical protein
LPLPRTLARWNKAGLNRVTKRVAPWMPGVRLVSPQLVHDENRRGIRPVERQVLRLIGVADFLSLKIAPAAGADSAPKPSAPT